MKKVSLFLALFLVFFMLHQTLAFSAGSKHSKASGEVTDVDSISGRVTLKDHGEYFVADAALLKNINRNDLVDVDIVEENGEARIHRIEKTGEAPHEEESLPVGKAVQGVLQATGQTAKFITSPIAPVHDTAGEAAGAVTESAGDMVKDAKGPEVKQKF